MLEFVEVLPRDDGSAVGEPWLDDALRNVPGYEELMSDDAGSSFGHGAYRLHTSVSAVSCQQAVSEGFGQLAASARVFAYDWLGRQFAVDFARPEDQQIVMFEPGTGQRFAIPVSFERFHSAELVEFADDALALEYFADWRRDVAFERALETTECVGYRVPLFLGGDDDLPNLELTDLDVYLTLSAQLLAQVAALPSGATVTSIIDGDSR